MTTAPNQQHLGQVCAPADNELELLNAYWMTANDLAVGMIYLQDNHWSWSFGPGTDCD